MTFFWNQNNYKKVSGSLCVFGDWFGRPYDNLHKVISLNKDKSYLKLTFDDDESLEAWEYEGVLVNKNKLIIESASKVRWEWFSYGKEKTDINRYFIEHANKNGKLTASSNVDWYVPNFNPNFDEPAVSIK